MLSPQVGIVALKKARSFLGGLYCINLARPTDLMIVRDGDLMRIDDQVGVPWRNY
jgi:hypothetical protein